MMWTTDQRARAFELHGQGWTDREMADHFGIERTTMASYRSNVMRVPANTQRRFSSHRRPCESCGSMVGVGQYARHMRERHDAVRMKGGRTKRSAVARVRPLKGRFDSAKVLAFLSENWRAA